MNPSEAAHLILTSVVSAFEVWKELGWKSYISFLGTQELIFLVVSVAPLEVI